LDERSDDGLQPPAQDDDTAVLQPAMVSSVEPVMVSLSNHQTGADSGLLRASETGMTFLSRSVIPVLDKRSDGQIPESLMMRGYDG